MTNTVRKTAPLDPDLKTWVAALALKKGDVATAEMLGVSRTTVARAAAGLAVTQAVANLIRVRHRELNAA